MDKILENIDQFLLLFTKLGLTLVFLIFIVRWFLIIPYLWLIYDCPIMKLKSNLDNFRKEQRKEPVVQTVIDDRIREESDRVDEKLEILETKRRLFMDRVNLFLSISSLSNKN